MPIRINLLAEEQAAEEMRRKDPIKRVIFAGILLTALMFVWIGLTYMKATAARSELANLESRLDRIDTQAASIKSNQSLIADIDSRIEALDEYASSRFFSANFLNALQQAAVPNLRLVEVRTVHNYTQGATAKIYATNLTVSYTPPPPFWKFWAKKPSAEPITEATAALFPGFTNSPPFSTNRIPYTYTANASSTNESLKRITVKTEFSTVPWTEEQVTVEIRGRDYGNNPGAAIDEFAKKLAGSEFFAEWLEHGQTIRFTERPPQPRADPADPVNPGALFLPFAIESALKERIFAE